MGRTRRKRKTKKTPNFYTCDDDKEIVLLNSWLAQNGIRRNNKLVLALFEDTGRGVLTKKKINSGEELINLPLNLTINVTTLAMDKTFCSIFLDNSINCVTEYKKTVPFQALMAFYLTFLRFLGEKSRWFIYLKSLPKDYTVPYFLPDSVTCDLDSDIVLIISKQKDTVLASYRVFEKLLSTTQSNNILVQSFKTYFSLCNYEWAYFTVNTRCVFMDLSKVIDLNNVNNSILNLISDNTKISLCPYLDMINHSPYARNETKLLITRDINNVRVENFCEELFSDINFSIYTKNDFNPFTQVFICYGDSHNLKLITEYGFFLPDNDLDFVSFTFEETNTYLLSKSLKLSQEQISFVNSHGLNKDLYIDLKGLSFNLYGLLMVVKYYYDQSTDVSRLLYSAAICSNDRNLNDIITPLVRNKLVSTKDSISRLRDKEQSVILGNCINLMCQYVKILEKFIKC